MSRPDGAEGDTGADAEGEDAVERLLGHDRLPHREWERALRADTVLGLECEDCGYVTATPKAACPRCGSRSVSVIQLPQAGTIYTKTTVEVAPTAHGRGYQIALVDLGDAKLLGRIADGHRVEIDDEVELTGTYEYNGDLAAVFAPA